jgi:imidazolonepropionase-like amidohydrolase
LKTSFAVFLPVCLAAGAVAYSCASPRDNVLAIVHATVIDMTGGPPLADRTVLVRGQRISVIGPSASVAAPRGTPTVDASGRFLIPGLVDTHVHLTAAGEPDGSRRFLLPLLVANGITGVRDMGGYLESLAPLREEIRQGKRLGPAMLYAGPFLDGAPPSFEPSQVVRNGAQASEEVLRLVANGVDFIKVQSRLTREAYFGVADAARRERIPFVGHVPDGVTAAEAADAGQHSIEHLTNVLRGCSGDEPRLLREQSYVPREKDAAALAHARIVRWQRRLLDSYSQSAAEGLLAKFLERNVWQTPTLVLLASDAFPTLENTDRNDPRLGYIPGALRAIWTRARVEQMRFVGESESRMRAELYARSAALVGEMQKAGVKILAGTDSPAPYVFAGFALHDELRRLVEAGLTPAEALATATRNPAEFLGNAKDSGTVSEGKFADLVLLDGNPLEDIRNTGRIRAVVVRGKLLDRAALDGLLDQEREFASR